MRTLVFICVAFLGVLLCVAQALAAPITYKIGPFTGNVPAHPNTGAPPIPGPYTVSATVTTDGKLGQLQASDILAYSWYVNGVLVGTQNDGTLISTFGFIGTPTAITIASPYQISLNPSYAADLTFLAPAYPNPNPLFPYIDFHVTAGVLGQSPFHENDYYYSGITERVTVAIPGGPMQPSAGVAEWNVPAIATNPFIFATAVPEPSSLVLGSLAALALLAFKARR